MAEENKNVSMENAVDAVAGETVNATNEKVTKDKKDKSVKGENFFKRIWKKIKKFCSDTFHEMKKVRWTSKEELKKSTILVVTMVIVIAAAIALVDVTFSKLINWIAGLIG